VKHKPCPPIARSVPDIALSRHIQGWMPPSFPYTLRRTPPAAMPGAPCQTIAAPRVRLSRQSWSGESAGRAKADDRGAFMLTGGQSGILNLLLKDSRAMATNFPEDYPATRTWRCDTCGAPRFCWGWLRDLEQPREGSGFQDHPQIPVRWWVALLIDGPQRSGRSWGNRNPAEFSYGGAANGRSRGSFAR